MNPPEKVSLGETYGRLTVVAKLPTKNGQRFYLCRCECGGEVEMPTGRLRGGHTKSCGCLQREAAARMKGRPETIQPGFRSGRLTVIENAGVNYKHNRLYLCVCECGTTKTIAGSELRSEKTKSCGCLNLQRTAERNKESAKYNGASKHPLFPTWSNMIKRCYDPRCEGFQDYGARGIRVCEAWLEDPWVFYADMGDKPTPKHSIDRIDNDGNYEPSNCRWATAYEQANNKRRKSTQVPIGIEEAIIQRYLEGGISQKDVGRKYGVRGCTVCGMIKRHRKRVVTLLP